MNNNFGIYPDSYVAILGELKKHPEIEKVVIFGSRAMGNYKKGSDIDIAIFGKNITFRVLSDIHYMLNEEIPVPYFFDIIHFESLKTEKLKKHIETKGKLLI